MSKTSKKIVKILQTNKNTIELTINNSHSINIFKMFRSYRDTIRMPVKTVKQSKSERKYYCDLCENEEDRNYAWDFELDFEIHRRKRHKEELLTLMREPKNYMCSVCMRTHPDRPCLISHIKKYHLLSADSSIIKREIFICDYCNSLFFNKLLLIAHMKYYHLNLTRTRNRTVCPVCDRSIMVRSIWFHFLYHGFHISTCPICVTTFENYDTVLEHIEQHSRYYMCNICVYMSHNENLFQNHMENHRKTVNIEGKDVNEVIRFFVPQKQAPTWSKNALIFFRGISLSPEVQICVLCRRMCESDEEMLQHIYGDHSTVHNVETKRHVCTCGEKFFNNVLLKHHIFTMKDGHGVFNATPTSSTTRKNPDYKKHFYIELEVSKTDDNKSETSNPATLMENISSRSEEERIKEYSLLFKSIEKSTKENQGCRNTEYETVYQVCSGEKVAKVLANYGQRSVESVAMETRSTSEGDAQAVVYKMIEIPIESNEQTSRVMEEPMYI